MMDRDTRELLLLRAATGALRALPAGAGVGLLRGLVRALDRWPVLRRDVVRAQIAAAFPQRDAAERAALADAVYDHLARTVVELLREDPARLAARVRVEPGWEPLDRALAAGRGAIAATAHLGNFELGGRVLASRYPLLDVVKPQRNRAFEARLQRLRNRHGIATVPMDLCGRAVLRHLAAGGLVSLFVDQDAGGAGLRLDFLGRPASTWPGAARFALRAGCPVVPLAIVRAEGSGGGHVLRLGVPIDVAAAPAEPERVNDLMARITEAVEAFVRAHPEQWFWIHRRWKGAASARPPAGRKETPCEA